MREEEILKEGKVSSVLDDTDRRIRQALLDELSDITVSRALFERTLFAVEGQKKKKRKKMYGYRIGGGVLTAAAAVLVIALGAGIVYNGRMAGKDSDDGTWSGGEPNRAESVQKIEEGGRVGAVMQEGKFEEGDGADAASPWGDATDVGEGDFLNGASLEPWQDREWLFSELLAAFDVGGGEAGSVFPGDAAEILPLEGNAEVMEEIPSPGGNTEDGAAQEETRSISWQWEGKELSCVIYGGDYRILATLQENGSVRELELRDWAYARQLWDAAAK